MNQETILEKQLRLFKEYDIRGDYHNDVNYHIKDDKITIDGSITVYQKIVDKDFLKDVIILGNLTIRLLDNCHKDFLRFTKICYEVSLPHIKDCHKDFLKNTIIGSNIDLSGLLNLPKGFLKGKIIPGNLFLNSITKCDKYSLKDTYVGGFIGLPELLECDNDTFKKTYLGKFFTFGSLDIESVELLRNNVKTINYAYNKKLKYCFFNGILSYVLNVTTVDGYTIYETPHDYVIQQGSYVTNNLSIENGINDLRNIHL